MYDDIVNIEVSVVAIKKFAKGNLLAMADVELFIDGVSFVISGIAVRRLKDVLAVEMPQTTNAVGHPIPAITLPPEVEQPLAIEVARAAGFESIEVVEAC